MLNNYFSRKRLLLILIQFERLFSSTIVHSINVKRELMSTKIYYYNVRKSTYLIKWNIKFYISEFILVVNDHGDGKIFHGINRKIGNWFETTILLWKLHDEFHGILWTKNVKFELWMQTPSKDKYHIFLYVHICTRLKVFIILYCHLSISKMKSLEK